MAFIQELVAQANRMHFKNFDLNMLVALDALLTEGSVTRAAKRLCVTQPAMSNTLQKLRVI